MKYLGYYDDQKGPEKRNCSPAAVTKMDYICGVLISLGDSVEIISLAPTVGRVRVQGERRRLNGGSELLLFSSFGYGGRVKNYLNMIFIRVQALLYLSKSVKPGETLLVYHSLALVFLVKALKMLRGFKIVCDVGEMYSQVNGTSDDRELEFFKLSDAFIFSTRHLNDVANASNKPFIVLHGTYDVPPINAGMLFEDQRVHCVYAGTFDPRKGVLAAIRSAEYLDEGYHMHIIGFGSREEEERTAALVEEIAQLTSCTLTYDGRREGGDYIRFLQSCQIGLSPQAPDAAFNMTSFPSKTLSYLSNGLKVVSIRIPAVEESDVGSQLFYYDNQTPEEIAKAIGIAANSVCIDSRIVVGELDKKFRNDLDLMLRLLTV